MSNGTTTWTYTYDAEGMRTSRTDGTTTYTYVYSGSQLSWMTIGTTELQFSYDANGRPLAVVYNGILYYYALNLQGDVVAILNMDGNPVVYYTYDAWGKLLSTTGSLASTLGTLNPLRYRGYVYDSETGLYYLQSRYYNPDWGRFINADAFVSTGQGLLGNNMFAYCNNNPANCVDLFGCTPSSIISYTCANQYGGGYGPNIEFLMAFWGVTSPSEVPDLLDGAMIFVENITSVSAGPYLSVIRGKTVVFDEYKYCEYTFCGTGVGLSVSLPMDQTITQGYVYGLNGAADYCGEFWGASFSCAAMSSGGAFAVGGVTSKIVTGTGTGVSFGISRTVYLTSQTDWIYGRANMAVVNNPAQLSSLNRVQQVCY